MFQPAEKPTQSLNWWMAPTTHPKPQINPYPRALYDYESFAVLINVLDVAVDYLLLITVFLGYFFLAAGLSSRFAPGKRRSLSIGISLMSLVALVLVLIGYHYQELAVLVGVGALGLIPAVAWLITLGVWLYRQDSALVGDPESA